MNQKVDEVEMELVYPRNAGLDPDFLEWYAYYGMNSDKGLDIIPEDIDTVKPPSYLRLPLITKAGIYMGMKRRSEYVEYFSSIDDHAKYTQYLRTITDKKSEINT